MYFDWCKYALKTRLICIIEKSHILCFQVLLSFVPTIFVFFFRSLFPASPDPSRFLFGLGDLDGRLRQIVSSRTTIIGYYETDGLSSEKCERGSGKIKTPHAESLSRKEA